MAKAKKTTATTPVQKSSEMRSYEVNFVVNPSISDADREKVLEWFRKLITTMGGQIDKTEEAGKKVLAYEIEKCSEGWFYFYDVHVPATSIKEIESKLRFEDAVIRYLVVRTDE